VNGPPIIDHNDEDITLRGVAVVDCARAVRAVIDSGRRRDGIEPPKRLQILAAILTEKAERVLSRARQGDVALHDGQQEFGRVDVTADWIGTREAAKVMQVSHRSAQRLAKSLGARRVAGRWLIDPAAVAEFVTERKRQREKWLQDRRL
jgi:hypothetical protein